MKVMRLLRYLHLSMMALAIVDVAVAQSNGYAKIQKLDSVLAARYYRQDSFDTAYIMRPATKWTFTARMNVSGTKIKT